MNDGRLENNNGRVPYGAYNQANAKLVTADGDYPSNYEHYSNFEPKKPTGIAHARNPGILKGLFLLKLLFLRNFLKGQYSRDVWKICSKIWNTFDPYGNLLSALITDKLGWTLLMLDT